MSPQKRASSVLNGDAGDHLTASPQDLPTSDADDAEALADDALALAEEAEAEAVAAEAAAVAARARARAVKLRRQASAIPKAAEVAEDAPAEATPTDAPEPAVDSETADLDQPTVDADADEGAANVEADAVPAKRRRPRLKAPRIRLPWIAATLVVLCTLGLLGASGYMMWHHRQVTAEQQRSADFAAAARQGVVTLMSLDFNHAQDDVKRILDNTTGDFKKDFEGQAEQFAEVAQSSKVVTEATVSSTAVQSMTKDTATVLVAVTTQVSNAASKEQEPRSWRLRVDMARDGGQLKLSKVEFVP